MITPFLQDDALLTDIETARQQPDQLHIWWLGQSGFLIQYAGQHLLFDPYLSDSLTRKYAHTDKPHDRISERVIDPARLPRIDVLTSSHNHTDHLDAETLGPILAHSPDARLVFPEANRAFVADRLSLAANTPTLVGLTDGQTVQLGPFRLYGVPAAHNELERDAQGWPRFMGFIARVGPYTLYHSGDTLWFDGLETLLQPFGVDVAFLPINGNKPERRVAGNLNPDEAARLGKAIGAGQVIPHHYDLFAFNTANPAEFIQACHTHQTPYRVLRLGERLTV
ncbi:MBL fold metallo-hydrolase [Rudanella paleaurantiibacter]|uniref:MBL fold metallo-hydrolase n=1 Tax=Rudanella paleaurantiibacter TaxID=2614655 RepID=A0A7J5TW05_9BACT|nr:MBL fold metallo-hydrolase [Rudanella paleaurantiibacter]KAB7728641.1 MBL fold metallo-hydrolase [Rudanella paleaurantiibacter]